MTPHPHARPGLPIVVDELHLRRLAAGLTRAATARRAGHGEATITDAEAGRTRPHTMTLRDLAAAVAPGDLTVADRIPHNLDCLSCAAASLAAFAIGAWWYPRHLTTPGGPAAAGILQDRYRHVLAPLATAARIIETTLEGDPQ